jgi:hypothetical protein
VNWIYQILKALLDWAREKPPTEIEHGQAPKPLKDDLAARVADLPGMPDQGGDGPAR